MDEEMVCPSGWGGGVMLVGRQTDSPPGSSPRDGWLVEAGNPVGVAPRPTATVLHPSISQI
jgi:hypothetical protein